MPSTAIIQGLGWLVLVGAAVLVGIVAWFAAIAYRKSVYENKIGTAEAKSREIIDEAMKVAETKKREAMLEAKEENLRAKNEFERETKDRRAELQKYERRVLSKEENVDKKAEQLERKETSLAAREENLNNRKKNLDDLEARKLAELERISGLTSEQAKEYLLQSVEEDVKHDTALMLKEYDARAKEEAAKKARDYVVTAIQK